MSIERFSKIIQEQIDQASAKPDRAEEVQELLQIQLKILTLWKKSIGRVPKDLSSPGAKTHWLQRKPMENPHVASAEETRDQRS